MDEDRQGRRRWVRRLRAGVLGIALLGSAVSCGDEDVEGPSAPDVSRAEPTGTVDTTVPQPE